MFWSDTCARAVGGDPLEALCLSDSGSKKQRYTRENDRCEAFEAGVPVDIHDTPYRDYDDEAPAF